MQQVTINQVCYEIPVNWSEITYAKGVEVIKEYDDKTKVLSIVSGIPIEVINKIADIDISKLFGLISFVDDQSVFENVTPKEEFKDFNFRSIEYGEAEYCRKLMNSGSSGYEVVAKIIHRLKGVDINNEPLTEVIGTANFFLTNSLISMLVTPSLVKAKSQMTNKGLVLEDSIILEALERMSSLLEEDRLEIQ